MWLLNYKFNLGGKQMLKKLLRNFKSLKFSIIFMTTFILILLSSVTIKSNTIHRKVSHTYNNQDNIEDEIIAYGIKVDEKIIGAVSTKQEAKDFLKSIKKYYIKDLDLLNVKIMENVEIIKVKTKIKNLKNNKDLLSNTVKQNNKENPIITVVTTENITEKEKMPYKTEYKKSNNLFSGQEDIEQKGKEGIKENILKVEKINGVEISKEVVSEKVKENPRTQIVLKGTKKMISSRGTGKFMMPIKGRLTSPFGPRGSRMHLGIDLASPTGTPIKASDNGIIKFSGYKGTYGYMILIDHGNGYFTRYAHSSKLHVNEGQKVAKGSIIAEVGNTGRSTGPHLHFEVIVNGENKDPYNFIK